MEIIEAGNGRDCMLKGAGVALGFLAGFARQGWGWAVALSIGSNSGHCFGA